MSASIFSEDDNALIANLPSKERHRLLAHCELVDLRLGDVLHQAKRTADYIYFPTSGVISLISELVGHTPLGSALIGNEGMLGAVLVLADSNTPLFGAIVQNTGKAWRMDASLLKQQVHDNPNLRLSLNHYLYRLIAQLAHSFGCMHFHNIEPRLARWLLMTQDRAHSEHFHLTHELLSKMLGVRRSGVTIAAGMLQNKKLISYNRGDISVLDRKGLIVAACECYCPLALNG